MRDLRSFLFCLVVLFGFFCMAESSGRRLDGRLEVPFGRLTRLPSPDGRHVLVGTSKRTDLSSQNCPKCISISSELWLEESLSHTRKLLLEVNSTASADWSPDGSAFFVEDHEGSNLTDAYIYNTQSMSKQDIGDRIVDADPEAKRFMMGHRYFNVDRWQDNGNLLVRFTGHTDESPVICFDIRYQVSREGKVNKLSKRTGPADAAWCGH